MGPGMTIDYRLVLMVHAIGSRFRFRLRFRTSEGLTLLRHQRHATDRRRSPRLLSGIERTISSMHPALQQPIPRCVYGNVPGYLEGCRNVETDKVQAGPGMLPGNLQQWLCSALAGGGVIETGTYLGEFVLACGVAGKEVHFVSTRRMHVAHFGIERLTSTIPKRCRARHERPNLGTLRAASCRLLTGHFEEVHHS